MTDGRFRGRTFLLKPLFIITALVCFLPGVFLFLSQQHTDMLLRHVGGQYRQSLVNIVLLFLVLIPIVVMIFLMVKRNKQLLAEIKVREETEEALKKSEEKYRSFFENAVEGMYQASLDGRLISVNPALARIAGFESPQEMIECVSASEARYANTTQRERITDSLKEKGFVKDYVILIKRKDGNSIWVSHNARAVKDEEGNILYHEGTVVDISARKAAEEESRRLTDIIRRSSELMNLSDPEGNLIFLNDAGSRMLGIDPENIEKTNIMQVIPSHLQGFMSSEVIPTLLAGGNWKGELQYLNLKTGSVTDVYAVTFTINDPDTERPKYFANVSLDITDRKQIEEKFAKVFMMAPVMITIVRLEDERLVDANLGAEMVTGWGLNDVPGEAENSSNFWANYPEDMDFLKDELMAGRDVMNREIQFKHKDGTIHTGIYSARPITISGDACAIMVLRDITDQLRLEDDRRKLEQQLFQAQKLDAIGKLAGGIAHDFNNILLAVSGNAQLAEADLSTDHPVRLNLSEIIKGCDRAADLVRRMLLFTRPRAQERRVIRLENVVKEALQLVRVAIPAMIGIETRFDPLVPPIRADAGQIHQIVVNLSTNGAYAIGENEGVLTFGIDSVEMNRDFPDMPHRLAEGRYVRLIVADNGCGMEQAVIDNIFDPFFTTKDVGQGTGLGLSVVHGIMRSIGGAVTAQSEPGKGSVFYLYFPAVEEGVEVEEEREALGRNLITVHGKRVLYVDDDSSLVTLIKRTLKRSGFIVTGFTDPLKALQEFLAYPDKFDVIVTDLAMPGMSGFVFAARLLAARPNIPVFMTSGYVRVDDEEKARQIGIRKLILKPNTIDELQRDLQKLFDEAM